LYPAEAQRNELFLKHEGHEEHEEKPNGKTKERLYPAKAPRRKEKINIMKTNTDNIKSRRGAEAQRKE